MTGPGIGIGGTLLVGEGIKRILKRVSVFPPFFPLIRDTNNNDLLTHSHLARLVSPHRQHANGRGNGRSYAGDGSGSVAAAPAAVGCLGYRGINRVWGR